jgi:hypothetical protein
LSESVIKSGVVGGKRYKEAVKEFEDATAKAAAEKAAVCLHHRKMRPSWMVKVAKRRRSESKMTRRRQKRRVSLMNPPCPLFNVILQRRLSCLSSHSTYLVEEEHTFDLSFETLDMKWVLVLQ